MILAAIILFSATVVNSQDVVPLRDYRAPYYYNYDETPKPYSFSYNAPLDDGVGHSSRQEVADGSGKVQGSYTLTNDEGHTRVVDYVADEAGFRASVRTNEPGTDNQSPADVIMESAAPFTYGSSYQYNPVRPPVAAPVVAPVTPAAPVEVVPEVAPAYYNLPGLYRNRNPMYRRQIVRNTYNRSPYYKK